MTTRQFGRLLLWRMALGTGIGVGGMFSLFCLMLLSAWLEFGWKT